MTVTPEHNASQLPEPGDSPRLTWTMPTLRALSASAAENNVGGSAPDAEGTS